MELGCAVRRFGRLGIAAIVTCSTALLAPHAAAADDQTVDAPTLQVGSVPPCDWRITVPVESVTSRRARSTLHDADRHLVARYPMLAVNSRSVAVGSTITVLGTGFTRSLGLVQLSAYTRDYDVFYSIPTGKGVAVNASGSFMKQLYIPYGLSGNPATLYARQQQRVIAHITFELTPAVGPEPPPAPFSIARIQTFDSHGRMTTTFHRREPITVRTFWTTRYIAFMTGFDFGVQVSLYRGRWRPVGPVERGSLRVTIEKQFCFMLTPPRGTYSQLRMKVGLGLSQYGASPPKLTQWRTVVVRIADG